MNELAEVRIALRDAVKGDIVRIGAVTFDVTHSSSTDEAMHLSKAGVVKAFLWLDLEWFEAEVYRKVPKPPQGLGAVVELPNGRQYVRLAVRKKPWRRAGSKYFWMNDNDMMNEGFKVLSPGIATAGGEEA